MVPVTEIRVASAAYLSSAVQPKQDVILVFVMDDNDIVLHTTSTSATPKPQSPSLSVIPDFTLEERLSATGNADPPPPYPSRDRRIRANTLRSCRRNAPSNSESVSGTEILHIDDTNETSPLLSTHRRQCTVSYSSAVTAESSHSLAQSVLSLFGVNGVAETLPLEVHDAEILSIRKIKLYFRPLWTKSYYIPLSHLLIINFPYALLSFLFLFIGTLASLSNSRQYSEMLITT